MYALGYDLGSSSVKVALVNLYTGEVASILSYPDHEMPIHAPQLGWAEQDPYYWWSAVCLATKKLIQKSNVNTSKIGSIGISYQMHGLVVIDKDQNPLRTAIIWCDSRATEIGNEAFQKLGAEYCLGHLLNSPGNFTASKLKWVMDHEPVLYSKIDKILLPGDFIAMKMTGEVLTTISGLSEGIFWDYKNNNIAATLLEYYNIEKSLLPPIVDTASNQGKLKRGAAETLGLPVGIPITYRAGDQPNNALSLGILHPGEVAATGGTSGVIYGISDTLAYDPLSRINGFAHVNHKQNQIRIGQLLCINGAGSQYAWTRKNVAGMEISYWTMESEAAQIEIGSDDLSILPFGNGAERIFQNKLIGAHVNNLQFNMHTKAHIYRATLEGIAYAFVYGARILEKIGIHGNTMRVGNDNLFQSDIFSTTVAHLLNCEIQMIRTTGAVGAARASGIALGVYDSFEDTVENIEIIRTCAPSQNTTPYQEGYNNWKEYLEKVIHDAV